MASSLIQIQIATSLSEIGVGDIRWVLLDPSDAGPPSPTQLNLGVASHPASPATSSRPTLQSPAPPKAPEPSGHPAAWTYQVLRAIVLVVALWGAWWVASSLLEQRPPAPKPALASTQVRR